MLAGFNGDLSYGSFSSCPAVAKRWLLLTQLCAVQGRGLVKKIYVDYYIFDASCSRIVVLTCHRWIAVRWWWWGWWCLRVDYFLQLRLLLLLLYIT